MLIQALDDEGNTTVESVLIEQLGEIEDTKTLQPDFIRSISLQDSNEKAKSWGVERIGAKQLHSKVLPSKDSVIVAVIDTGVDFTHPFLKDRIIEGYDVVNDDTNPMDVHSHGTAVTGIIADTTPANVKIMPIRAINAEGNGYDSDIAKGIRFAVDNGADIINMSFSGEGFSPYLSEAIDYALTNKVLVIVAAGNESMDTANLYPASDERVIVVSATDQNDRIADFSNTGASIDISAPGVDILSSAPGGKFSSNSGTSLAAPFVSGIAAMIKLEDPTRSTAEIEKLLKKYIDDRGATGWDPLFGEGIVNVTAYDEGIISSHDTGFIPFPEQQDVPLDASLSISFDRPLTDGDIVAIQIVRGDKELPVTFNKQKQTIAVTPLKPFLPRTTYRLLLIVEHGKDYEMTFVTGD